MSADPSRLIAALARDRLSGIPVVHFGDIDPNGVRIMLHLRRRALDLKWFLPDFWFELADACGLRAAWPQDLDLDFAPAQVRELAARGLWLEQERIVLDARMADVLEAALTADTPGEPSAMTATRTLVADSEHPGNPMHLHHQHGDVKPT